VEVPCPESGQEFHLPSTLGYVPMLIRSTEFKRNTKKELPRSSACILQSCNSVGRGITRGNNIYFRPGVYDPSTVDGLADLGHELVHVGQYRNGATWLKYLWAARHGYGKSKYEEPPFEKHDEIRAKEKCGCPKQ